jgi:geranylgeranyl pyrophosphate synthase
MPVSTNSLLDPYRLRLEKALSAALTRDTDSQPCKHLALDELREASRHAALDGGKRVRPLLVYLSAQCVAEQNNTALNLALVDAAAVAVELLHCYSLIHDDLPAMDNDDLRRGKPTCHIAFSEATAILTGDGLQTLAFETLANSSLQSTEQQLAMLSALAQAAGFSGMIGGQAIDLAAENAAIDYETLIAMHQLKTGALIACAAQLGAIAAGANKAQQTALHNYAQKIGLAFQLRDDILDVEGSSDVTGKTQGADIAANKSTFPSLIGLSATRELAETLAQQAITALTDLGHPADALRELAGFIVKRDA